MSELRHDPIQKRWVIIAEERQHRASDFIVSNPLISNAENCPFCPGNEDALRKPIYTLTDNNEPPNNGKWRIKVVPNRYPALAVEPSELGRSAEGLYDRMNGVGAHEVIIEGQEHSDNMADYPLSKLTDVLKVYRERLIDLMKDSRLRYVLVFKNAGEAAGATLSHPHSQIIATPITPRTVAIELESCREHYRQKERCLVCDIIHQETSNGSRIVYDDGAFVTLAPYASRFPFELMILPRQHLHCYGKNTDEQLYLLAQCLKDSLTRLKRALNNPAFNFVLHTAPNSEAKPIRPGYWVTLAYDYHWHLEIIPRLTKMAGFEWGSGFYINPTAPENAAKFLRELRNHG